MSPLPPQRTPCVHIMQVFQGLLVFVALWLLLIVLNANRRGPDWRHCWLFKAKFVNAIMREAGSLIKTKLFKSGVKIHCLMHFSERISTGSDDTGREWLTLDEHHRVWVVFSHGHITRYLGNNTRRERDRNNSLFSCVLPW